MKKSKKADVANASGRGEASWRGRQALEHVGLVGHDEGYGFYSTLEICSSSGICVYR